MKRLIFGLLTTLVFLTGKAQTDAGSMFIGGTLKFGTASFFNPDSSGYFKGTNFNFEIAPEFGYFVTDNFALGVTAVFGNSIEKSYDSFLGVLVSQKVLERSYGGGIFGQYFIELNKDLFLSFKGTLAYNYLKGSTSVTTPAIGIFPSITNITASSVSNVVSFNIVPSIEYFVNDNLGLSLSFGNLFISQLWNKNVLLSDPVAITTTNFGLDLDLSTIKFGMKFFIK